MTGSTGLVWKSERVSRPTAPERPAPQRSRRAAKPGDAPERRSRAAGSPGPAPQRPNWWRSFTARYGWRAYAIPVLVVISVIALVTTGARHTGAPDTESAPASTSPPTAVPDKQLKTDTPGAGAVKTVLPALALPPGAAYTTQGAGTFATIAGTSKVFGHGPLKKFSIEVENGVRGVDLNQFASVVMSSLSNAQSWAAHGGYSLQRVDSGAVDFHISLTSSMTVRALCGYDLPVETSCYDGGQTRVVLNVARWVRGAGAYAGDLATYRIYAVNHEVGHALGHNHSHVCLKDGLAPVMMQQTIGTKTAGGQICKPNPWPYPTGVADAPGPEQPGDAADLQFFKDNS